MRTAFMTILTVALVSSAWATATIDSNNILTFNVESGEETYSTALTSTIDGIVKTGAGTIILTASSTAFSSGKPITISGGAIEIQNANALGSGNTVTVANGATFRMMYSSGDGQNNDIVLQGGSTLYLGGGGSMDYFLGNVTLTGDATLNLQDRRGFGKTLDLGGYTLTRTGLNREMVFTGTGAAGSTAVVKGPGTILNGVQSTITFMGTSSFDDTVVVEAAASDTTINMWNRATPVPCKLKVTESAIFKMGRGRINNVSGTPLANIWNGNVEIATGKTLKFQGNSYPGDYLTIGGAISGAGAVHITAQANGAIFQFKNTNTYTGGTTINGSLLRACVDGAVSTAGPVTMSGGELQVVLDEGGYTDVGLNALLDKPITYTWTSGSTQFAVYTSAGVEATTAANFANVPGGIGILHRGEGKATIMTDAMADGATLLSREGTIAFGGNADRHLWGFQVIGGTMDLIGGTFWRGIENLGRTFKVGASNDVTNARMRLMGGRLYFLNSGGSAQKVEVEDNGSKPSILEIHNGSAVTGIVQIATTANTRGAICQYGGVFHHLSAAGRDSWFAKYGQAFYGLYGGTFDVEGWLGVAGDKAGIGMVEIENGSFTVTGGDSPLVLGRSAGHAELYMGGGAMTVANRIVMGGLEYAPDPGVDGGFAVLTLAGTNNPTLTLSGQLQMCERTNGYTSVVNLNAGTLTATSIQMPDWNHAYRVGCKSYLNFNGGTYKSSSAAALSATTLAPTRVTVFGKGATIDYNGGNASWNVPFLRPDGRGIKSITIPAEAAVSGYAIPPVVTISGGGGEGATAHVRFNPRTGTIDRDIEVTSPGWGFIMEPTVTITAPDMKTAVACNVELTEGEQEDGGLTKTGSGYLSVYAANSYTGDTVIAGGTFYMQNASAVPPKSNIRLAGGHLATKTYNPVRARLGGYGSVASWTPYNITITNEIYFFASDLEQGRRIDSTGGTFKIGDECVITVDGIETLTQNRYTLIDVHGTDSVAISGQARLAGAEPTRWKVSISADKTKMYLRRLHSMVYSIK